MTLFAGLGSHKRSININRPGKRTASWNQELRAALPRISVRKDHRRSFQANRK